MIDHVALNVRDYEATRPFYEQALKPLGYSIAKEWEGGIGFGLGGGSELAVRRHDEPSAPVHLAVTSSDRAGVDAFYEAALAAGGRDNGPPGIRADYHENYYAAFVLDPEGNNVEAVCHKPE